MSILRLLYTMVIRLFVRLFTPSVIIALPADDRREYFPFGLKLVAVDSWKTQWTIIEGFHNARVDRGGIWYMPETELEPRAVFTLREARALAANLASVGELGELTVGGVSAGELSASGSTAGGSTAVN